jgi:hypothetical protein
MKGQHVADATADGLFILDHQDLDARLPFHLREV